MAVCLRVKRVLYIMIGMAIIASGESSKDMWITSSDWTDCNAVRLLRERVPFDISSDIVK